MTSPYIAGLFIYPIKSLDGVSVEKATVLESGALKHDREWAIFDEQGNFVNGKRNPKVHLLRSTFGDNIHKLFLQIQGTEQRTVFDIKNDQTSLEAWLSDYFGFPVKCVENSITGFPDDTNASGPTVISTATIEEVASWFPGVSIEEMRLRLRANIEIGGVPAFWEDQLFTEAGQSVLFQVGEVLFHGVNPCQRCVVVTRDSQTATATPQFQKTFVTQRKQSLPSWTTPSRFNHFYRLSVNTNIPTTEAGKVLSVGDSVKILGLL
ncbi:MAG: MOSC N-terminal beta barrel domain-containing protein [Scytonema sp. PMC 1069.18]|nr:MOSC N-terminal beta barrel domain-containing protein [Scytonema sp. PMC 1069.18]MEC4882241.1 MOSC N-terminal beta barrel domain-containing protein [Scytonema sp. PMC 1070.18]